MVCFNTVGFNFYAILAQTKWIYSDRKDQWLSLGLGDKTDYKGPWGNFLGWKSTLFYFYCFFFLFCLILFLQNQKKKYYVSWFWWWVHRYIVITPSICTFKNVILLQANCHNKIYVVQSMCMSLGNCNLKKKKKWNATIHPSEWLKSKNPTTPLIDKDIW